MLDLNSTTLVGRSVSDSTLRQAGESQVCSFRLVYNKRVKKRDGTMDEKPMFIDCDTWGARAEYASKYVKKGAVVLVQGSLELDEWEADGQKRQKHKIYVNNMQVERPKGEAGAGEESAAPPTTSKSSKPAGTKGRKPSSDEDDSLPF